MEGNKFWVCIIGLLATAVVTIAVCCVGMYHYKVMKMASMGYEEVSYPGSQRGYFQKVR